MNKRQIAKHLLSFCLGVLVGSVLFPRPVAAPVEPVSIPATVVKVTTYKVVYEDSGSIEYIEAENMLENGTIITFYDAEWKATRVIAANQVRTVIRVDAGNPW